MLNISRIAYERIVDHARKDAPIEACGYLAARDGLIEIVRELRNTDASPEHFSFDPAEQFAAVKEFRASGHRLAGVYHSHPESPSRPSEEDLRLLSDPNLSYLIVSLAEKEAVVKSFRIIDGKSTEELIGIKE